MGLLPDLELQVVDVLQVVLPQPLTPGAAPPLRRRSSSTSSDRRARDFARIAPASTAGATSVLIATITS